MERNFEYSIVHEQSGVFLADDNNLISHLISCGVKENFVEQVYTKKEYIDEQNFWVRFGYKYMGCLMVELEKGKKLENICSKEYMTIENKIHFMLKSIFELCYGNQINDSSLFNCEENEQRIIIKGNIIEGIDLYKSLDGLNIDNQLFVDSIIRYLANNMTKKELISIQELPVIHEVNGMRYVYPLTVDGNYTMGIINPWPGDKSAEAEVLSRLKVGAEDIGLGYVMLDNYGHILENDTQKATAQYVNPDNLQFAMTTHYDSEKTVDAFHYHTLWNPPEIPLNLPDYDTRVTNNYLMNDDFLIYDFGGMSNHLRGILSNKPRTLEGASSLTASFPKSKMLAPTLDDPKLFYCGMNWEKVVSNSNRHEGLFKLLDETGKVKFFGPDKVEAWGGLRPWEGYKCYQYSIPFDGFSILNEINKCGICLVLSSDIHRRAGAATNRTYEACAAGAVIISDDNEFMKYYFKDAALFIEYNKNNPQDTFAQIMEKYNWIIEHKSEALEMAKKAQEIFLEHFSADNQLHKIVNKHYSRFKTIEKDLFAKDESGKVLVSYVVNTLDSEQAIKDCNKVLSNIKNQYYNNIHLGIVADSRISKIIEPIIRSKWFDSTVVEMNLFDNKGSRQYTDGQAIRILQKSVEHDYWINSFSHEIWYYDHITTLIRTIQDENSMCAYSGRMHKDDLGYTRGDFFDKMHISTVFGMCCPDWLPVPGQILFSEKCEESVNEYMDECLDGYEHYAYLGLVWIKENKKVSFSKRMTCGWSSMDIDERCGVLKAEYQIRYIRDLLRFYIPDGGLSISASNSSIKEYMLNMPLKPWMKSRIYNSMLKYKLKKTTKYKDKIMKKYNEELEKFMSY